MTKKKFFNTLKNINKIPKLSKSQQLIAKKALFYFEYLDKGIALKKSKIIDNHAIEEVLKSKDKKTIFCKKLIENMNKFNIEEDQMFKTIKYLV